MKKILALICLLFLLWLPGAKASEVFIRMNDGGTYEITVDDQLQRNSNGNFRFFDIPSGSVKIKIKEGSSIIDVFSGRVNIRENKRYIYEYSNGNLVEIATARVSEDCAFPAGNHQHYGNNNNGCDESSFNEMLSMLKEKSFDSQIVEKAKVFTPKANFTSSQVKRICDLMQYDSNKLEYAKYAYDYVVDKGSYFVVEKTFTYNSSKDELEKYITNR